MAEETTRFTAVESVVGGLAVSLVCDHAVVSTFLDLVRNDHRPSVTSTCLHRLVRRRHLRHALLGRIHVSLVLLILVLLVNLSAC